MNTRRVIAKYLARDKLYERWPLHGAPRGGTEQAVVIPALAEQQRLFITLAALAGNSPEELQRTLVICVINNGPRHNSDPVLLADNDATLEILHHLAYRRLPSRIDSASPAWKDLQTIHHAGLRLAYVDAASAGCSLPERGGGVGLARKIGIDGAVAVLAAQGQWSGFIACLDADTRVEENYLSALRRFFIRHREDGAVIAFTHEIPHEPALQAAICCYETYLRYYALGLHYAGSPYAFPTIGSTIACSAAAYAAVRGMPRLAAGEDFYFLNKLAKVGRIGCIDETTVHPAARMSRRAPFGTGQRMIRFVNRERNEYILYHPEVFVILRRWLKIMDAAYDLSGKVALAQAEAVHPMLAAFLEVQGFATTWERIRKNTRRPGFLLRQFHDWFDGFRTLKLIHFLTDHAFPWIAMFPAVACLLSMTGREDSASIFADEIPEYGEQRRLLSLLRLDAPPPFPYTSDA